MGLGVLQPGCVTCGCAVPCESVDFSTLEAEVTISGLSITESNVNCWGLPGPEDCDDPNVTHILPYDSQSGVYYLFRRFIWVESGPNPFQHCDYVVEAWVTCIDDETFAAEATVYTASSSPGLICLSKADFGDAFTPTTTFSPLVLGAEYTIPFDAITTDTSGCTPRCTFSGTPASAKIRFQVA